ncbi:hypothetical protein BCV70DRAFT_191945 [Testicularia cyperi]|uniref:G-protein coupled receptors family 1 profile domain-containing protein n=1 Tax=Testicularia cyperi TaxID=1882483 RepID=A0A317XP17_9BASI|nr:hypothetical protein BCV70DRAFT_191945 [Testicularia cyperi]
MVTSIFGFGGTAGYSTDADARFRSYIDDPSIKLTNSTDPNVTFQHESVGSTGNKVDMAICVVSLVGCIAIILPYVCNRRSRKLRHSLILGLATSDLVTTVVIIITTALLLDNVNLVAQEAACTVLGYILVTSIFTQHLWNLTIAIVTYMILVHPLSSFTLAVEKRLIWLWPIFWLLAFALNASAWGVGGFGFKGGYCAFRTNFYYASIFQFVPRAIVFVVILCLYTHLFFFLRRTSLFKKAGSFASRSNRSKSSGTNLEQQQQLQQQTQQEKSIHAADLALGMVGVEKSVFAPNGAGSSERSSTAERQSGISSGSKKTLRERMLSVLNKNDPPSTGLSATGQEHRRSSSLGEKDGSVELMPLDAALRPPDLQSRHSSDAAADPALSGLLSYRLPTSPQAASTVRAPLQPEAGESLLDPNYSMASSQPSAPAARTNAPPRRPVPASLDIVKANGGHDLDEAAMLHSPCSPSIGGESSAGQGTLSTKGSAAPLISALRASDSSESILGQQQRARSGKSRPQRRPATTECSDARQRVSDEDGEANRSYAYTTRRGGRIVQRRASLGDSSDSDNEKGDDSSIEEVQELHRMKPRKDVGDFDMLTPPIEHLKHVTAPRAFARMTEILAMGDDELANAQGTNGPPRRGSVVQIMPGEVVVEMPTKEEFDRALGDDWNWGMNVGGAALGKSTVRNRQAPPSSNDGINTGTSSTSSDEHGVESIGSTLNRQASLLLLLYPAAYCILFSISMVRIVVDLVNPAASVRNSHDALHSLSRWLVFAQGAIDALIFQFVERQFRQRMKRRRRKAMGEAVEDSFSIKLGKAAVDHIRKGWNVVHPHQHSDTCSHQQQHPARSEDRTLITSQAANRDRLRSGQP